MQAGAPLAPTLDEVAEFLGQREPTRAERPQCRRSSRAMMASPELERKHATQTGSVTDRLRGALVRECHLGLSRRSCTRYVCDRLIDRPNPDDTRAGSQRLNGRHRWRPRSEQRRQHPEVTAVRGGWLEPPHPRRTCAIAVGWATGGHQNGREAASRSVRALSGLAPRRPARGASGPADPVPLAVQAVARTMTWGRGAVPTTSQVVPRGY